MNRVFLINKNKSPDRKELISSERAAGDLFFAQYDLQWAGFILVEGRGKKCANWIIPEKSLDDFLEFLKNHEFEGYEVQVFAPSTTNFGGQTSIRIM